jgi:hypothetical protein
VEQNITDGNLDLIYVLYLWLIIFLLGANVSVDSEMFLVTDFVNLKIKSTEFFRGVHKIKCVYIHGGKWWYVYLIPIFIWLKKYYGR